MAQKRTIDIDIKNNAGETAKDFDNLSKATNRAADSADRLDATFEEVYGELQPLTTRMGEAEDRLYELALAGDTTSKEYNDLLKSVGNYRKVQIQTDLAVDAAATTLSQKLGGALTGATSGFAAVQGVMGLVGSESEALEETLLKVQSALALQQGVQGVLEYSKSIGLAGKATKVFNLIVKANPLALLATTLIAIIGYFAVFTDAIDVAINKLKSITDFIGLTDFAEQELEEKRKKRDEVALNRFKRIQEAAKKAEKEAKERAAEEKLRLEKQAEAYREYVADRLAAARQIEDLELSILEDGVEKEVEISNVKFNRLLEDLKTNTEINAKERKRLNELYLFQQQEAENDIRNEFRQKQLEAEKQFSVESLNVKKLIADEEVKIQAEQFAKLDKQAKEYSATQKRETERNKEFRVQAAFDTLNLINNITELFGKKGEKQAKKAFKVQQAAQIATTLATTYLSATQAYASQFLPLPDPSSPVRGGIAAGLAVAAGLANVAKIASQKFEGGGSTGSASVSGSVPDSGTQAPQFNVVGDSGVNQLAQLQQQPTQAFVVSGEVTTAQALDRNRVQNATL